MKSVEFCYWLQGYFEIDACNGRSLTEAQVKTIQKHLALVFKHEIDPSYSDGKDLDAIHNPGAHNSGGPVFRC
jgi:hypothetical protein